MEGRGGMEGAMEGSDEGVEEVVLRLLCPRWWSRGASKPDWIISGELGREWDIVEVLMEGAEVEELSESKRENVEGRTGDSDEASGEWGWGSSCIMGDGGWGGEEVVVEKEGGSSDMMGDKCASSITNASGGSRVSIERSSTATGDAVCTSASPATIIVANTEWSSSSSSTTCSLSLSLSLLPLLIPSACLVLIPNVLSIGLPAFELDTSLALLTETVCLTPNADGKETSVGPPVPALAALRPPPNAPEGREVGAART
jgi:hypothetical protein